MKHYTTVEVKQNIEPQKFSDNLGRKFTFTERMGSSRRGSGGKQNAVLFIEGASEERKYLKQGKHSITACCIGLQQELHARKDHTSVDM